MRKIFPIEISGYTANNEDELKELYELDVITLEQLDNFTANKDEMLVYAELQKVKLDNKTYKKALEEKCYEFLRLERDLEFYESLCRKEKKEVGNE